MEVYRVNAVFLLITHKKTIIPNAEWLRHTNDEICRVKSLEGDNHGNKGMWTKESRGNNIYDEDPCTFIKGIKKKTSDLLVTVGITTVRGLKQPNGDDTTIRHIVKNVKGIGKKGLTKYINHAMIALPGSCPPMVDHTKAVDPHVSLFGARADEKIENSVTCINYTSINKLIDHMMFATEQVMKGAVYEKIGKYTMMRYCS